jgi:predicted nucleic acid-binding protein
MIVLDTNVLSELMRPKPDDGVIVWIKGHSASRLFTTSVTQAEIFHGILLLAPGRRRTALQEAAEAMFAEDLGGRVLPFGSDAALPYARIAAARRRAGRPISHFDAQIAAISVVHGAVLATRNVLDFEGCGVDLVDPWQRRGGGG